jgi:streptogramin lyase
VLGVLVAGVAGAAGPVGTVSSYSDPGIDFPRGITLGPDGALWFTSAANDSIGRIDTGGTVTTYPGPGIDGPFRIAAGPDGLLWFTNFVGDSIGSIDPGGGVVDHPDPSIDDPAGITAGPDGGIWFTNNGADSIGRIDPFSWVVDEYIGAGISQPGAITAGPDGALWFSNFGNGSIGRITTGGAVTNYPDPSIAQPRGITAGPDGALWFTNSGNGSIGRITTGGVVTNYTDPTIAEPIWIAVGPDGDLWFTDAGNDSIGRIATDGTVTNYASPLIGQPGTITAGPDDGLWFTNTTLDTIGRIQALATDGDGDGIEDTIDTGNGTFQDAGTTAGTIDANGFTVTVTDLPDPAGVRVTVAGSGAGKAKIAFFNPTSATPCGTVRLAPGDDARVTCGSITVEVLVGSAEVVLSDDTTLTVDEGEVATIAISSDGSFVVTAVSGGDGQVTLTSAGVSTGVAPSAATINLWDFAGFLAPVRPVGLTAVNPGSTVPLKWRLLTESGAPVTTLASVAAFLTPIDCQSGAPTGAAQSVAASATKFKNLGDGYYQVNWTTDRHAIGCATLALVLAGEGPIGHEARFRFG